MASFLKHCSRKSRSAGDTISGSGAYVGMAYTVMACIGMAFIVMAYIVMAGDTISGSGACRDWVWAQRTGFRLNGLGLGSADWV